MTNLIVDAAASRIFIIFKADLCSDSAMAFNIISHKYFDIPASDPWFNKRTKLFMNVRK